MSGRIAERVSGMSREYGAASRSARLVVRLAKMHLQGCRHAAVIFYYYEGSSAGNGLGRVVGLLVNMM